MFRKYPKLFQDPHIDYTIDNFDLNFANYILNCRNIIAKYRVDLNHHPDLIIAANAPFELIPQRPIFAEKNPNKIKYGALLIHGLFDSPFMLKDIGNSLQTQGLLTRSILLPGHGTVPGSLLNVTYEDWVQTVRYGVASLAKEVEKIFLVGFSTGAILSLYHTLLNPAQIAGIIMLSPALKINSFFDFATDWHRLISWASPKAKWMALENEIDYTKYRSTTYNAGYQVYRLTQEVKKITQSKQLYCPLFMGLSYEDRIIASSQSIQYFLTLPNPKNQMILYAKDKHHYQDNRIIVRNSVYPHWNIINFCHVSIPISPTNPHYGINGDYPLASHVEMKTNILYGALDIPLKKYYDILYQLKLTKYKHQRLTFNPDFDFLSASIEKFISNVDAT